MIFPATRLDLSGERFHVDLTTVPVVGHTRADMDAALAVGARPFLVRTGYGETALAAYEQEGGVPEGVQVYADLAEVVTVHETRKTRLDWDYRGRVEV